MMVPVRCFTCGKLVGDKWEEFSKRVFEKKEEAKKVLDELGIERYCCRRTIFSHADTIDDIMKYPS